MDGTYKILLFAVTLLPLLQGGESAALPCDHRLRLAFPQLFLHCNTVDCPYSDWSDWKMVPNSVVTSSDPACESGEAYMENRTRSALGCEDETETRFACKCIHSD